MGHTRLGKIPKSKKWNTLVVEMVGEGSSTLSSTLLSEEIEEIALQTLVAAGGGLNAAKSDAGLIYVFYLLSQIALASKKVGWYDELNNIGFHLSPTDSLMDFTTEVQSMVDDYLIRNHLESDISEIAQKAVSESLMVVLEPQAHTLFGSDLDELRITLKSYSTKTGFSNLSQVFFGRFLARFMNFYLSRITATIIGTNRLHHIGDISVFNTSLKNHCEQSARIVKDFSGEWYSKTDYMEGINLENTSKFIAVAVNKLQTELGKQREEQ